MTHEEAREIYNAMITPCNETAYDDDTESDIRRIADTVTAAVAAAFEACALAAESEKVDAESTGTESDAAYNQACDDCAAAIRARGAGGKEK